MIEHSIVEILNPMTTFNNTDYSEMAHIGPGCMRCGLMFNCRNDFSLTNPEYTSLIFLSYYPEFKPLFDYYPSTSTPPTEGDTEEGGETDVPSESDEPIVNQYTKLFDNFYNMANHCLNERKFGKWDWEYMMSAFIAHYMILSLQKLNAIDTSAEKDNLPQLITALSNQHMGLAVKESLGGEEIQTEQMINVGLNKDAGLFMTTPYGREFWDKYIGYAKNFFRGVY